jgi:RimJ/RimL family protein N-acetyltransferase
MSWTDQPTLTGRHVRLRPLREDDTDAFGRLVVDNGLVDLFYSNAMFFADAPKAMADILRERDYGRAMPFAVETPDGALVGMTRYLRMNPQHRRLEIGGTFYARSVRRTGLNTEAKLLLLTHAFGVMDCNVVQIRTDWFNRKSQAAIERLGARRDGVLRGHQVMDGRVRDLVVYSIIAAEWPGVKRNLNYLLSQGEKP